MADVENRCRGRLAAGPVLASAQAYGYGDAPDDRYPDKPGTETVLPLIHVVTMVNLTKVQGEINFVHPLSQGLVSGIERASTVILRFKRADEQVLHEYPVGVKLRSCIDPGEDRTGLVDDTIGVEAEARIVELLVAGKLVDTYRGSERLPTGSRTDRKGGWRIGRSLFRQVPAPHSAWAADNADRGLAFSRRSACLNWNDMTPKDQLSAQRRDRDKRATEASGLRVP